MTAHEKNVKLIFLESWMSEVLNFTPHLWVKTVKNESYYCIIKCLGSNTVTVHIKNVYLLNSYYNNYTNLNSHNKEPQEFRLPTTQHVD